MDRATLLARRASYMEELEDTQESIDLYESGTFTMHSQTLGQPKKDITPQMLDTARRAKKTYEDIIADIDARLNAL